MLIDDRNYAATLFIAIMFGDGRLRERDTRSVWEGNSRMARVWLLTLL